MNLCDKCKKLIIMHAFCTSICKNCSKEVITGHIPGYKYCEECANKLNICIQCGDKFTK